MSYRFPQILLAISLLLCATDSWALGPVYQTPNGFWLAPNHHRAKLYGPSRPDANWNISPWDIPEDLPAFDGTGVSRNAWARVAWLGDARYDLSQEAATLPCERVFPSGARLVDEFDLLASPNNANVPRYPQAIADNQAVLADTSRIEADISLWIKTAEIVDTACAVSKTFFIYAVVISNPVRHQYFFYQLRLAFFTSSGSSVVNGEATPGWFFTGKNIQSGRSGHWGYGDNISSFGQPWAQVGRPQSYSVDLLPRLRSLIEEGARTGLDQDLSHWRLTGTYHGQIAMGHVRNQAEWSGFSLKAE